VDWSSTATVDWLTWANSVSVEYGNGGLAYVAHLRAAASVAREIVTGNERTLQHRVIWIHACIDICDGNAGAAVLNAAWVASVRMSWLPWLENVAMPNVCAVVGEGRFIGEIRWKPRQPSLPGSERIGPSQS